MHGGIGSLVGALFGLVYVVVNAATMPDWRAVPLQVVAAVAFVAVVLPVRRAAARAAADASPGAGPRTTAGAAPAQRPVERRRDVPRTYALIVVLEALALFAGVWLLNGPLDLPTAGVAWVSVVVGVHFLPLGRLLEVPAFVPLGAAIATCGVVGLVLALLGVAEPVVAGVAGVVPGLLLLGLSWWGTRVDLRATGTTPAASGEVR